MTEIAEAPAENADRRLFAHWDIESHRLRPPILRYGFSIVSVAIALGLSLLTQYLQFRDVELPLFTLAIALTTWYAGNGPAVMAVLLSTASFDYYFVEPIHSFEISVRDLPYFFIFVIWAAIVASFSAVRRRIEDNLLQARQQLARRADDLEAANKELEAFAYSVSHDLRDASPGLCSRSRGSARSGRAQEAVAGGPARGRAAAAPVRWSYDVTALSVRLASPTTSEPHDTHAQ